MLVSSLYEKKRKTDGELRHDACVFVICTLWCVLTRLAMCEKLTTAMWRWHSSLQSAKRKRKNKAYSYSFYFPMPVYRLFVWFFSPFWLFIILFLFLWIGCGNILLPFESNVWLFIFFQELFLFAFTLKFEQYHKVIWKNKTQLSINKISPTSVLPMRISCVSSPDPVPVGSAPSPPRRPVPPFPVPSHMPCSPGCQRPTSAGHKRWTRWTSP